MRVEREEGRGRRQGAVRKSHGVLLPGERQWRVLGVGRGQERGRR